MGKFLVSGILGLLFFLVDCFLAAASIPTAILVDKKTNNLYVSQYVEGHFKVVDTFHVTLGRVSGDKEDEDDLKTPEGIYTFTSAIAPPALQKKFGALGFYINFPNTFDQLAGRSGSGIMLHATDEPDRLKKNYDSQGCIVVNNQEILEIKPYIRLGLTPILIFSELTPDYMEPGRNAMLTSFVQHWMQSWESKQINDYIDDYHSDFAAQGKNKDAWKAYKHRLNSIYSKIEIHAENILYYRHPKYSVVTFTQNYRSHLKTGGWGHRSRGTKILYIAEEAGKPKIIAETFTNLIW
jgi:murein L,D-transpeptidase YafK